MSLPLAALIQGPLQWLFRKDREGRVAPRRHQRRPRLGRPAEGTSACGVRAAGPLPPARRRDASWSAASSSSKSARPSPPARRRTAAGPTQAPPAGGIENLYLAGDYTRTGWPATMEGAVRSGYLAAEAVLAGATAAAAPANTFLQPDLPPQWPARLLSRGPSPAAAGPRESVRPDRVERQSAKTPRCGPQGKAGLCSVGSGSERRVGIFGRKRVAEAGTLATQSLPGGPALGSSSSLFQSPPASLPNIPRRGGRHFKIGRRTATVAR